MEKTQNIKKTIAKKEKQISELENRIRILKSEIKSLQGKKLDECGFSTRTCTAFRYKMLSTVGDLKEYMEQDPELKDIHGIGKVSRKEIYEFLEKN